MTSENYQQIAGRNVLWIVEESRWERYEEYRQRNRYIQSPDELTLCYMTELLYAMSNQIETLQRAVDELRDRARGVGQSWYEPKE